MHALNACRLITFLVIINPAIKWCIYINVTINHIQNHSINQSNTCENVFAFASQNLSLPVKKI